MPDKHARPVRGKTEKAGGKGWGGPAKGFVDKPPDPTHLAPKRAKGTPPPGPTEKSLERKAINERMKSLLASIADNEAESTLNRMTAADKWLDRDEGKPRQMVAASDKDGKEVSLLDLILAAHKLPPT